MSHHKIKIYIYIFYDGRGASLHGRTSPLLSAISYHGIWSGRPDNYLESCEIKREKMWEGWKDVREKGKVWDGNLQRDVFFWEGVSLSPIKGEVFSVASIIRKTIAKPCFSSPSPLLKTISLFSLSSLIPLQSLGSVESLKGRRVREKFSDDKERRRTQHLIFSFLH